MDDPDERPRPGPQFSTADELVVWQAIAARRASLDSLMWQTPALGMTAQAFLLTLALSAGSARWSRMIAAALSLILTIMVMQLMAKHRRHELLDSLLLQRLEQRLVLTTILGTEPHAGPNARPVGDLDHAARRLRRSTPGPKGFWQMSSYELWMVGLGLFGVAASAVIVFAAIGIDGRLLG